MIKLSDGACGEHLARKRVQKKFQNYSWSFGIDEAWVFSLARAVTATGRNIRQCCVSLMARMTTALHETASSSRLAFLLGVERMEDI